MMIKLKIYGIFYFKITYPKSMREDHFQEGKHLLGNTLFNLCYNSNYNSNSFSTLIMFR